MEISTVSIIAACYQMKVRNPGDPIKDATVAAIEAADRHTVTTADKQRVLHAAIAWAGLMQDHSDRSNLSEFFTALERLDPDFGEISTHFDYLRGLRFENGDVIESKIGEPLVVNELAELDFIFYRACKSVDFCMSYLRSLRIEGNFEEEVNNHLSAVRGRWVMY